MPTHLEYAGAIRRAPGVEKVVFASADKPLSTVGKLEWEDTAVMQVKLILVGLGVMQYLDIAVLHSETQTRQN